jgi:proteasome accessory factor B
VRPYALEPSALTHALYLIGFDEDRGAVRTFKVERILSASLTPETFAPDPGFDPSAELRRAWDIMADEPLETVVLRFAPSVAKRVAETRWHPSQELETQPDGSLVWRGRVAGVREIRLWILGWGADVEVLGPSSLRTDIAAALRHAADVYQSPG